MRLASSSSSHCELVIKWANKQNNHLPTHKKKKMKRNLMPTCRSHRTERSPSYQMNNHSTIAPVVVVYFFELEWNLKRKKRINWREEKRWSHLETNRKVLVRWIICDQPTTWNKRTTFFTTREEQNLALCNVLCWASSAAAAAGDWWCNDAAKGVAMLKHNITTRRRRRGRSTQSKKTGTFLWHSTRDRLHTHSFYCNE